MWVLKFEIYTFKKNLQISRFINLAEIFPIN